MRGRLTYVQDGSLYVTKIILQMKLLPDTVSRQPPLDKHTNRHIQTATCRETVNVYVKPLSGLG